MDLIDRQALLKQVDIDSDGEPGYYGDTWKFIDTIKSMPSATDKNVGTKLGIDPYKIERAIRGLTEWQKHVQTESDIDRDISVAVEALKAQLGTDLAEVGMDCISRQAAIRWVKTECNPYGKPTLDFESGKKVIDHLEQMPSAQPEIIRCRECKFASGDSRICMKFDHSPIGELDFCSFAERREVNNESN